MTEDYRKEFNAIGIKDQLIDNIIENADNIEAANAVQEKFKSISKEVYHSNLALYNSIYTEIIGICKLAASFYKNKSFKKSLFTFTRMAGTAKNSKKHSVQTEYKNNSTQYENSAASDTNSLNNNF